jgi:hypothetical protein
MVSAKYKGEILRKPKELKLSISFFGNRKWDYHLVKESLKYQEKNCEQVEEK